MLPIWRETIAKGGDSDTAHLGIALALLDEGHGSRSDAEALREAKRRQLMDGRRDGTRLFGLAVKRCPPPLGTRVRSGGRSATNDRHV
jgi:hypothetical protein